MVPGAGACSRPLALRLRLGRRLRFRQLARRWRLRSRHSCSAICPAAVAQVTLRVIQG